MHSQRRLGKILVTGADGFIGSHLVERLVEMGYEVTALCMYNSNCSYGWLDTYSQLSAGNLKLILGDLRDPFFIDSSIKGHETVFHLASLIAIPYSYQAPQSYVETNIVGSLNIVQACLKNKVQRLIHTSTSEVYGTAQYVPICEKHPLQGQSPYSASKIGADMIVESYIRSFGLPGVTLRPFNTYGPRQSLRAVIPTVITQVLAGQDEIILGSLDPTRDFNFVNDTVEAFVSVAEAADEKVIGQVFNAGSEREISIRDLVHLIAKLAGRDVRVALDEQRLRPEKSEVERLLADASKLKKATSWHSKTTLEVGLRQTIDWLKIHRPKSDVSSYVR